MIAARLYLARIGWLVVAAWMIVGGAGVCAAADQPVESGKKALGRVGGNWYDSQQDGLRRIDFNTRVEEEKPVERRARTPSKGGGEAASLGMMLMWGVVIGVLVILCLAMAKFFLGGAGEPRDEKRSQAAVNRARIEALPFELKSVDGDLLAEARRRYEAGDYSGAFVYLYSHELVELDRQQVIRLARGKTNRQYLREASRCGGLRGIVEPCMIAFEEAFFGHRQLDRARFEASWGRLEEFRALATQGATA
ncbi:MAG: hypothetical protein JSS27_11800 [Planctomycetes bacterium]|nr:hypothetical protein [Planctomycetota bacterium]